MRRATLFVIFSEFRRNSPDNHITTTTTTAAAAAAAAAATTTATNMNKSRRMIGPLFVKMYAYACINEIAKLPGQGYSNLVNQLLEATTMVKAIHLWYTDDPNAYETKELYQKYTQLLEAEERLIKSNE